jgi:glycosyltransferase involved in cell wall biosynthesis
MTSDVSIVIPSKDSPGIGDTVRSIRSSSTPPLEVVIVDASIPPLKVVVEPSDKFPLRLIHRPSSQLEAQAIGTRASIGDRILFLDSDQRLSRDLLLELSAMSEAAVMMREISPGNGLLSRLMTRNSDYLIRLSQLHPSVWGLAIPRLFLRRDLLRAFDELGPLVFSTGLWRDAHPDSVLFAFWASSNRIDISTSLGVARNPIYHVAPSLVALYRKTYAYGRKRAEFLKEYSKIAPEDSHSVPEIIARANLRRTYADRSAGINLAGFALDCLKLPAYLAGSVMSERGRM